MIDRLLYKQKQSLDELLKKDYDSMADKLVDAALDGNFRAIQEIDRAIDEAERRPQPSRTEAKASVYVEF